MLRDGLSGDEAHKRINSQMPQEEKQRYADYLIDTSDGFELTRERTKVVSRTTGEASDILPNDLGISQEPNLLGARQLRVPGFVFWFLP